MKQDDNVKPVAMLDGHVTPKEAAEMFAKLAKKLEEEAKLEKEREQSKVQSKKS
ncbi:hypothetical protein ACY2DA_09985 [Staphylococcus simulans]